MLAISMVITAMMPSAVIAATISVMHDTTVQHQHYAQNRDNFNEFFHCECSFTFSMTTTLLEKSGGIMPVV
jgi:hypothetical protein